MSGFALRPLREPLEIRFLEETLQNALDAFTTTYDDYKKVLESEK